MPLISPLMPVPQHWQKLFAKFLALLKARLYKWSSNLYNVTAIQNAAEIKQEDVKWCNYNENHGNSFSELAKTIRHVMTVDVTNPRARNPFNAATTLPDLSHADNAAHCYIKLTNVYTGWAKINHTVFFISHELEM